MRGEKFVLIASDAMPLADLPALLGKLLADLRMPFNLEDRTIPVSATIGAAWLDMNVKDGSELLHRTDIALHKANQFRRGTAAILNTGEGVLADKPTINDLVDCSAA
ncbi:putative signal transduction protein with EAL and GGDEF domain [Sphingobium xenophagum]|uniref:Signal transduction protein with EAL and GGDEF domain n=1 Tax=Sphingobium xenophagum TaxID=121428 RepID=A0ABU1X3P0_SPHXE|nr:diguanylate cyclase [Sphingobium xenophagum]MDR7155752.1 putative signal transduction protein with EAL and GGDEF domain [Sphingobium xenophagum]